YKLAHGAAPDAETVLRGVDYAMTHMYAHPPMIEGHIDWAKMSYTYLKNTMGDYLSPNHIDAHHTAVRYAVRAMFSKLERDPPTEAFLDSMPAFLIHQIPHRGAATEGIPVFHRILEQRLPRGTIDLDEITVQRILDELEGTYHDFGRDDVFLVTRQW